MGYLLNALAFATLCCFVYNISFVIASAAMEYYQMEV